MCRAASIVGWSWRFEISAVRFGKVEWSGGYVLRFAGRSFWVSELRVCGEGIVSFRPHALWAFGSEKDVYLGRVSGSDDVEDWQRMAMFGVRRCSGLGRNGNALRVDRYLNMEVEFAFASLLCVDM
jgi:hypothetical protein